MINTAGFNIIVWMAKDRMNENDIMPKPVQRRITNEIAWFRSEQRFKWGFSLTPIQDSGPWACIQSNPLNLIKNQNEHIQALSLSHWI